VTLVSKDNLDEVQHWMVQRRFARFARTRLLVLPLLGGLMLLTLLGDRSVWRWLILGTMVALTLLRAGAPLLRRELRLPKPPDWSVVFAVVPLGAVMVATGGFDSPALPFVLLGCFFVGTLAPVRTLVTLTLSMACLVCLLAAVSAFGLIPDLMPSIFGGGARLVQPPSLLFAKAGGLVAGLWWSAVVSATVREIFHQIVHDALDARDEVLQSHDTHARELTALSGELAHELKNPLANVKGLAVLAAREAQGKAVERLGVLQGEVLRMEEILQGFLTFSRPLSAMSQEEVDLQRLCESVLALHEGMAFSAEVVLRSSAPAAVRLWCDPRKVKQILINLVQNALQASPAGATVEVGLEARPGGGARVAVRDRGPGLSADARAHLFEAGATTKERGTGLGLALARGLARQHGGDLTLLNREGGGCEASLELPGTRAPTLEEAP
jgi:two-component system, NtrC family, sensor histidine kinase HydH